MAGLASGIRASGFSSMSITDKTEQSFNIQLLDRFYGIFAMVGIVFLTVGVPFVFYRKTASAAACLILLAVVAAAWRMSRGGQPQKSLKLFALVMWLLLVGLVFGGLPPITVATALAISVMLAVVISLRAGVVFSGSYMLAWLAYIVLSALDLLPLPYFPGKPLASWFMGSIAVWLVLLPIPHLIRNLRQSLSRQKRLVENEGLLRNIIESLDEGVLMLDSQGLIIFANPAALLLLGRKQEELLGTHCPWLIYDKNELVDGCPLCTARIGRAPFFSRDVAFRRDDGTSFPVSIRATPTGGDGNGLVIAFYDISIEKAAQERIAQLAHYDPLTELPNRRLFFDRLSQALALAHRTGSSCSLLFLDLDRFKDVNDRRGHVAGDTLLKVVAERLRNLVRESDTVARLAGDEFTVILCGIGGRDDCARVAEKIITSLGMPVDLAGHEECIGVSIGIALFPDDATDSEGLIRAADHAMYAAKAAGRGAFRFAGELAP